MKKSDGFAVGLKDNEVTVLEPKGDDDKAEEEKEEIKPRKEPSADSPYRWLCLGVVVGFTSLVFGVLIILVALPEEN